jgi:hypothetical protein
MLLASFEMGQPLQISTRHRNPSQVPTPKGWEAVKDHIYRLYVIENRPLRNVRTILSQDFGFRATYAEKTPKFRP